MYRRRIADRGSRGEYFTESERVVLFADPVPDLRCFRPYFHEADRCARRLLSDFSLNG